MSTSSIPAFVVLHEYIHKLDLSVLLEFMLPKFVDGADGEDVLAQLAQNLETHGSSLALLRANDLHEKIFRTAEIWRCIEQVGLYDLQVWRLVGIVSEIWMYAMELPSIAI